MNFFASNLRLLRKKANLTQEELSGEIGVLKNTVSNYENGKSSPDFDILYEIIKYFDISAQRLLFEDLSIDVMPQTYFNRSESSVQLEHHVKILLQNDEINSKEINAQKKKIYEILLQLGSIKEDIKALKEEEKLRRKKASL